MEVALIGHTLSGESFVIAETEFPLKSIKPVDIFHTFDLYHSQNEKTASGKIELTLKLILPKKGQLAENRLSDLQADYEDYREQLDTIYQLVPRLKSYKPQSGSAEFFQSNKTELEKEKKSAFHFGSTNYKSPAPVGLETPGTHGTQAFYPAHHYGAVEAPKDFEVGFGRVSSALKIRFATLPKNKMKVLLFCGYGWMTLALLSSVFQPLFPDISLSLFYVFCKLNDQHIEAHWLFTKYSLYLMISLFLFDIFCLITGSTVNIPCFSFIFWWSRTSIPIPLTNGGSKSCPGSWFSSWSLSKYFSSFPFNSVVHHHHFDFPRLS